jgi:hypothetical protein
MIHTDRANIGHTSYVGQSGHKRNVKSPQSNAKWPKSEVKKQLLDIKWPHPDLKWPKGEVKCSKPEVKWPQSYMERPQFESKSGHNET